MGETLLEVRNLEVSFLTHVGEVRAVRNVSFKVEKGQILGIVGESGSGKSTVLMAIMGLIQKPGRIKSGSIIFEGEDLIRKKPAEMRSIRGNRIAMVFQDPMSSLNPVFRVGDQIAEAITTHQRVSRQEARRRVVELLDMVKIPSAKTRANSYPHEFSGGMRQRAMIALALACSPTLLLADEPTTALDVTIQAQIMELLREIQRETGTSVILVTHDLAVVSEMCSYVEVMYGGRLMEESPCRELFEHPSHPYTNGLLRSVPNVQSGSRSRLTPIEGSPPDLITPFDGCPFVYRCPSAMRICMARASNKWEVGADHRCACHLRDPRVAELLSKEGGNG